MGFLRGIGSWAWSGVWGGVEWGGDKVFQSACNFECAVPWLCVSCCDTASLPRLAKALLTEAVGFSLVLVGELGHQTGNVLVISSTDNSQYPRRPPGYRLFGNAAVPAVRLCIAGRTFLLHEPPAIMEG